MDVLKGLIVVEHIDKMNKLLKYEQIALTKLILEM